MNRLAAQAEPTDEVDGIDVAHEIRQLAQDGVVERPGFRSVSDVLAVKRQDPLSMNRDPESCKGLGRKVDTQRVRRPGPRLSCIVQWYPDRHVDGVDVSPSFAHGLQELPRGRKLVSVDEPLLDRPVALEERIPRKAVLFVHDCCGEVLAGAV